MKKLLTQLSRNIKTIREEKGLSQQALSERSGLDRTYIGKIERGDRVPSLGTIVKIASGAGIEPHRLLQSEQDGSARNDHEGSVKLFKTLNQQIKNHFRLFEGMVEKPSSDSDTAVGILERTSRHFTTLANLYERLLTRDSLERISVDDFLMDVIEQTRETVDHNGEYRQITLETDLASDVSLAPKDVVTCGLVVHELVRNSFQHGFKPGGSGRISVTFEVTEEGNRFSLVVSDDGSGGINQSSLDGSLSGLSIVKQLVIENLRGAVSLDNPDAGSRVSVSFSRRDIAQSDPEDLI